MKNSEIIQQKMNTILKTRASGNFWIFNEKYHLKSLEKLKKFRFSVEKIWTFSNASERSERAENFGVFLLKSA